MSGEHFTHKGFLGSARIDAEAGGIRGRVGNTRDMITFHGKTVAEAEQAFRESVDDYLEYCGKLGVVPEKPFSGNILVRVRSEIHRSLAWISQAEGVPIAEIARRALVREVRIARRKYATATQVAAHSGPKSRTEVAPRASPAIRPMMRIRTSIQNDGPEVGRDVASSSPSRVACPPVRSEAFANTGGQTIRITLCERW